MQTATSQGSGSSAAERVRVLRGVVEEFTPASGDRPAVAVLSVPGSNYRLYLRPESGAENAIAAKLGRSVAAVVRVQARRVDVVGTGGRYIEPLFGRPRRVQGTVLEIDAAANALVINAGGAIAVDGAPMPIIVTVTAPGQRAEAFGVGSLVSMDVKEGGTIALV